METYIPQEELSHVQRILYGKKLELVDWDFSKIISISFFNLIDTAISNDFDFNYFIRELQLPDSCKKNEDDVEVKGFKFGSLTEELREKR